MVKCPRNGRGRRFFLKNPPGTPAHRPFRTVRGHPRPHLAILPAKPSGTLRRREDLMSETKISFQSGGRKLVGTVRVPDGVKPGERRPAWIVMHGFGSNSS